MVRLSKHIVTPFLPTGRNPGLWLSPSYRRDMDRDGLQQYHVTEPFDHFVLTDFIRQSTFDTLSDACASADSTNCIDADDRQMIVEPLLHRPAVEFMAGPFLRRLLSSLLGVCIKRHPTSIPQVRRNIGPTPPLSVHTDQGVPFELITFLYVHQRWSPESGGELCLHSLSPEGAFSTPVSIVPLPNTFVGMVVSKQSYHSVAPLRPNIVRTAIYQEWTFVR